jgi:hypothetical protein
MGLCHAIELIAAAKMITPHTSRQSGEDRHGGIDLFCANFLNWLGGQSMPNVTDWARGY